MLPINMYWYIIPTILVLAIYYYFTRTLNYWAHKNVKGPKPIPVFGNYKDVALRRKAKVMLYNEIYNQYPEEKVVGLYQMTSPTLLIRDLDIVKQVLIKDFSLFPDRGMYFSKKGLGENIIHCDADTWKILRNQFTVLFTSSKFKNMFHILDDRGDKFANYVKYITKNQIEQDVFNLVFKYGVSTSIVTAFGFDVDTFKNEPDWFDILDKNFINSYLLELDLLFPGLLTKMNLSITIGETKNICHRILKTCLNQENTSYKTNVLSVKDVLNNLRSNDNNAERIKNESDPTIEITDDLLTGQVWAFHMAGYINNTLSMTYALYHLARNQDVQDKLRKEIHEVMKKCNGTLTYELLKEMKYLKMVFYETLRKNPPTHVLTRYLRENLKLEGVDLTIEKGSTVVMCPYAIQHDEKYYPEPEKFNPERFSTENAKQQHPCAFLSFGGGPRGCLGE